MFVNKVQNVYSAKTIGELFCTLREFCNKLVYCSFARVRMLVKMHCDVPIAPCLCTLLTSVVAAIVPSCLCAL